MERLKTPAEYAEAHPKAFRCAFDFLRAHFPPGTDPEWWDATSNDASAAVNSMGGESLTSHLMIGVLDYLEEEYKLRREHE